jgi:sensor histidine kinase YesM
LKHGIARLPDGGGIRISAKRVGDLLRIEVENDGPPLPEGFSLDTIEGIGLSNLRSRLAALFGEAGTLRLVDAPGRHGVLAAVDIPFRDHAGQRMARAG